MKKVTVEQIFDVLRFIKNGQISHERLDEFLGEIRKEPAVFDGKKQYRRLLKRARKLVGVMDTDHRFRALLAIAKFTGDMEDIQKARTSIPSPTVERANALAEIGKITGDSNDFSSAGNIVEHSSFLHRQFRVMEYLSSNPPDLPSARSAADATTDPIDRAGMLLEIAKKSKKVLDFSRARSNMGNIGNDGMRMTSFLELAKITNSPEDFDSCRALAGGITEPWIKFQLLSEIAKTSGSSSDLEPMRRELNNLDDGHRFPAWVIRSEITRTWSDFESARQAATETVAMIGPVGFFKTWAKLAGITGCTEDFDNAREAASKLDRTHKFIVQTELASAYASAGLFPEAIQEASKIPDAYNRSMSFLEIAGAINKALKKEETEYDA